MKKSKGAQKDNQNARKHGFYSRALSEAEQVELELASLVEGIDQEISFLRLKLKQISEQHPDRLDLQFEAANTIARLIRTNYQITGEQKQTLRDSIRKVLTEVALPLGIDIVIGSRK